ncbi:MAG TPA: ribosome rescue protein RqcH [Methanothrix sp.]|jgi:predicted ribosome quality control (RQC) complex YloA/Tae2 family protein|nr:fibronectin-binding domain-containing protein [Methanothrix sp.]HOI70301.1 ribosome rescue protein RqcH [Methanothrix sp.]HPY72884.1 ribosome rescue protein RqcH [Methanothrix sp.]HQA62265.1 ribosome rescue protein RqcH [Methanothrix sp.]
MKKAMSNVDVAAVVDELQEKLVGGFVGKSYQLSPDRVVISFQSPGSGKLDLLLEAGRRIHLTEKPREAPKMPPQFPTMLRSRLSGGRVAAVRQHGFDRMAEIEIERGDDRYVLIAEIFPKGNVLLLDAGGRIVLPLRPLAFRDRKLLAGETYQYREDQLDPRTVSRNDLAFILASSDSELVRTLVRGLNMGGTYAEEVCLRAGINKTEPAHALVGEEIDRLHRALGEVFGLVEAYPHIVADGERIVDVVPAPLAVYDGLERREFGSFSEALDEFFSSEEADAEEAKPKTALERRREMQERSIQEFREREQELARLGEKIYERYGEVEAVLAGISKGFDRGFTYSEILAKIKTSGLPIAEKILSLDYQGELRLRLDDPGDGGVGGGGTVGEVGRKGEAIGAVLELNANLTVPQNAQRYYDRAKEQAKKREGAEKALEETIRLMARKDGHEKAKTRAVFRRRKPKWYERFRWFYSSDGFLVIGGRDASSNEEIYAKYLEKRDLALHTDAPGAPLTVIKTLGEAVPESTLEEAASFAVSYSSLWKAGLFAGDCYLVGAEQVTKTPEPGEFLKKGAFVVRGERRYYRDVPLGLALGIAEDQLIGGPVSAVKPRADPTVEVEPGELSAEDLAKRIYRSFAEKEDDRRRLKAIASVDQIVSFLPPGGSRVKG